MFLKQLRAEDLAFLSAQASQHGTNPPQAVTASSRGEAIPITAGAVHMAEEMAHSEAGAVHTEAEAALCQAVAEHRREEVVQDQAEMGIRRVKAMSRATESKSRP